MEQYSKSLKVFISYSHKNTEDKNQIVRYLAKSGNQFEILSDEMLKPGYDWNTILTRFRDEADVFLLLVSEFYLSSETINNELRQILERGNSGKAYVIPVILSECSWSNMPFAKSRLFQNSEFQLVGSKIKMPLMNK